MGHSQSEKAANRERILAQAARQVRSGGLESVHIGPLMKSLGLTHGGFYGHFESRAALLSQALERALRDSAARTRGVGEDQRSKRFSSMVGSYLSRAHRDTPDTGCALASLASDTARANTSLREVMHAHVDEFIRTTAGSLAEGAAPEAEHEGEAALAVSAMIGALLLARIIPDARRSDWLLREVRDRLRAMLA